MQKEAAITEIVPSEDGAQPGKGQKRGSSAISFPYQDLADATTLVKSVYDVGGTFCQIDPLAAKLNTNSDNYPFRQQIHTARIFGLAQYRRGTVILTPMGASVCDPEQEQAAKVEAFLTVPLYNAIYEQFKGRTLPPLKILESAMAALGVPVKQASKARQVFQRSAEQAGFFWSGPDRLVRPAANGRVTDQPSDRETAKQKQQDNGVDGGGGHRLHPLIEGLIKALPSEDKPWPAEKRVKWLRAAAQNFDIIYPDSDDSTTILIKLETGSAQ